MGRSPLEVNWMNYRKKWSGEPRNRSDLLEDLGLISSTHMVPHNHLHFQSQGIQCPFLASTGTKNTRGTQTYMYANTLHDASSSTHSRALVDKKLQISIRKARSLQDRMQQQASSQQPVQPSASLPSQGGALPQPTSEQPITLQVLLNQEAQLEPCKDTELGATSSFFHSPASCPELHSSLIPESPVSSVSQHSPPGTSSLKLLTSFEVDSVNRSAFHRQGLPEAWGPGVRRGVRAGGSPSPQERAWRGGRVTGCLPWGVAPGRVPAGPGRGVGCSSVSHSPCRPGRASCAGCR